MEADSEQEVSGRLKAQGYQVVHLSHAPASATGSATAVATSRSSAMPSSSLGAAPPTESVAMFGPTATAAQLGTFFRQLASLMHAGFSVSNAFSDLGMRTPNRALGETAKSIAGATAYGASVATEMAKYPTLFPPHVTGLVAAGEAGGFLEFSFEEAALNQEQDDALGQGLWVPRLLIWQAIWSVLLLQPLFPSVQVTNDIGPDMVRASGMAYAHSLLFVAIPIGIALHVLSHFGGKMWRQPWARRFHDTVSLRIPVMAHLAKMRALASFTRMLRRLLMAGISTEPAFVAAARSVPNIVLSEHILETGAPIVRANEGIDKAIAATGLMGDDPLQLLVTGQKTGQWLEMLDRVTAFYQERAVVATDAAKNAQKRSGVIITLLSMGYVTIVCTAGCYNLIFKVTDGIAK